MIFQTISLIYSALNLKIPFPLQIIFLYKRMISKKKIYDLNINQTILRDTLITIQYYQNSSSQVIVYFNYPDDLLSIFQFRH